MGESFRADKGRVDELRVEVEVKESFTKKLVRNRLKWAGIVERMGDDNIGKEIRCPESERRRGRGRPSMR